MTDQPRDTAAVTATAEAIARMLGDQQVTQYHRDFAGMVLAAALPHLTAAAEPGLVLRGDEVHRALDAARAEGAACEREDCALLAEQHNARYLVRSEDFADGYPSGLEPFADLIRARRVVTAVTAVTAAAGRQS